MELAAHITRILAPHLGEHTADSVARHLCAKHHMGEGPVTPEKARELQDVIRRGLVAFVGPEKAEQLAKTCLDGL
jgi:hypothetical protein